MPLGPADFTSIGQDFSLTTATSFTFILSQALAANHLALIVVVAYNVTNDDPGTPAVTISGIAATQVATASINSFSRAWLFRALGASPSGTNLVVNFGADDMATCGVHAVDVANVDTSGVNGAGAIVQSATPTTGTSTAPAATLAAFASGNNAAYGGVYADPGGAQVVTAGSGFTLLGAIDTAFAYSEAKAGQDTSVDFALANSADWAMFAAEIAAAGGGGGTSPMFRGSRG